VGGRHSLVFLAGVGGQEVFVKLSNEFWHPWATPCRWRSLGGTMNATQTLHAHLLQELRKQFDGDAWHGDALEVILEGISAAQASRRMGTAHSIWEIVLHIAGWTQEVTRRLQGGEAGDPADGDWPAVADVSDAAWQDARRRLRELHQAVLVIVARVPPAELHAPVQDFRNSPDGRGRTVAETISGLIQHDVYHAGQIAILKRLLRD